MKKILLITLEYPPQIGGIATYCHDLAAALPQDSVVVLAPGGDDIHASHQQKLTWDTAQSYRTIRRKLFWPKFIWPRWTRLIWHVWLIVRKEKIDIIFVQHVLPVGYAAIFAKKILKVPFLLFSHGTDLVAGTSSPWKKKMVTAVSCHALQIIFNSESLKRRYLRALPQFGDISLVVYPCPLPTFLDSPPENELKTLRSKYALEGKQVLLSVSRLNDGKGFPHLIAAMPQILKQNPNLVWFIIGDGPKRDQIINSIQKNNLKNVVRFIGEIPHTELQKYYYLADLFVLLTHPDEGREEGLGLVFLEASAAGLPIVAGRSGGVEEAVLHTQTGIVVETHNGTEVTHAILELLKNHEYAKRLGDAAKERIRLEFQWGRQVEKLNKWIV